MKFPEKYRAVSKGTAFETKSGDPYGVFIVPAIDAKGRTIQVIACDSTGTDWEHASVSLAELHFKNNTPSWEEMCFVKELFWDDSECVVQYHPPKKDNISIGEVLHLWKWTKPFPMPPKECV